jgi:hypothetical protein
LRHIHFFRFRKVAGIAMNARQLLFRVLPTAVIRAIAPGRPVRVYLGMIGCTVLTG